MNFLVGKTFNESATRVCNTLVNNPIYDGPVYDSIHPQFENLHVHKQEDTEGTNNNTLADTQDIQILVSNTLDSCHNNTHMEDIVRYHKQPLCSSTSLTLHSQDCKNQSSRDEQILVNPSIAATTSTNIGFVNPMTLSDEYTLMQTPTEGWDEC